MRRNSLVWAALAALAVLPHSLLVAPVASGVEPTAAPAGAVTTIAGVRLTAGDASLVGAQITTLTVTVRLTNPQGVNAGPGGWGDGFGTMCPCLTVGTGSQRPVTPTASNSRFVSLHLVSGSQQDGEWQGTTFLGAASAGVWRPLSIYAAELHTSGEESTFGYTNPVTPPGLEQMAALNVRGTDWPVVTVRQPVRPRPFAAFVVRGTALLSRSHTRARLTVNPGGYMCDEPFGRNGALRPATVGRTGGWSSTSLDRQGTWCAEYGTDAEGQPIARAVSSAILTRFRAAVSASPARARVVHGTDVAVTGRVWPANERGVILQRLVGRSWKTVGRTVPTRGRGSFRLVATPPRAGANTYRVVAASQAEAAVASAASSRFVIRAT